MLLAQETPLSLLALLRVRSILTVAALCCPNIPSVPPLCPPVETQGVNLLPAGTLADTRGLTKPQN